MDACRFNSGIVSSLPLPEGLLYSFHLVLISGIGSFCLILTLSGRWKPRFPVLFFAFVIERIIFNAVIFAIMKGDIHFRGYVLLGLIEFPFVYYCLWIDSQYWSNLTLDGDLTPKSVETAIEMLQQPLVRYLCL